MTSYLRWMPPKAPELFHDKVREIDFRISRLEGQRVDMAQRIGVDDDETMWAYANALPVWLPFNTAIVDPVYNPEKLPYGPLTLDFTVPTDDSFLYVVWGASTFTVIPGLPNNSGTFDGASYKLELDGVEIEEQVRPAGLSSWQTFNLLAPLSIPYEVYSGRVAPLKPIPINAGAHTLELDVKTVTAATAGSVVWTFNRFIRGFVHA